MPGAISSESLSCIKAYQSLWRSESTEVEIDRLLAPSFVDHTPAADPTGRDEFKVHHRMVLGALSDLEARIEPIMASHERLAAHATIGGTHTGGFLGLAPTGKRLSWREVHVFEVHDGQIAEHWMDAGLLSGYMQIAGQAEPDRELPRMVSSGLQRAYNAQEQAVPIDGYMDMVASHDPSMVADWASEDYIQHGPFGSNVSRDEFEAGNRDIVWKALPDISIELEPLLADGELVAARGRGRGTHMGAELFGVPATGKQVTFTETHVYRLRGGAVCEHWLQVDLLGLLRQLQS